MSVPKFTMRQLLEAGVHFGHNSRRWNPLMSSYIFGERNNIHIIDLQQTVPRLYTALHVLREIAAQGGKVLFVGTKRQASERIREAAEESGQFYVNHRWLGGMMTNWQTISKSIKTLEEAEATLAVGEESGLTKKELLVVDRQREKLERSLGGIREMGGRPDAIFVIDTNKEELAVKEANKLGIPVFAVLDTNCDPAGVDFPIPGNDDSLRAIDLYCELITKTILDGIKEQLKTAGVAVEEGQEKPQTEEKLDKKAKTKEEAQEEPAVKVEKKVTKRASKKADEKADAQDSADAAEEKKTAQA